MWNVKVNDFFYIILNFFLCFLKINYSQDKMIDKINSCEKQI